MFSFLMTTHNVNVDNEDKIWSNFTGTACIFLLLLIRGNCLKEGKESKEVV